MGLFDMISGAKDKLAQAFGFAAPDETIESLSKYVLDKYKDLREQKRPYDLRSMLALNFLQGNQYCDVNTETNQIRQFQKRYSYESREVFNRLAPIYEARIAQLTRQQPSPHVRPASGEPSDIVTARTSSAVLRDIEEYNHMKDMRHTAIAWAEITGDCFVKTVWNPDAGDVVGEDESGEIRNGYPQKILVNSFEFFPYSMNVPGMENQSGCIHAKAYPVDYINDKYGVKLKGRTVDTFSLSLSGEAGSGGFSFNTTSPVVNKTGLKDHVLVLELMELPCKRFPKGAIILQCEDQILDFHEMSYFVGERNAPALPYEQYSCITMPTSFFSESVIWRLIPVQRSYNAVRNKKMEALNRKAMGVLAIENDGNVDAEELEAEGIYPGKIFPYERGSQPPRFIHDRISTTDFDSEESRIVSMFEEISGVSPFASHGQTPAGMVSGSAIEKLREQDTARIGLTIENINNAAVRGFKISLRLCKQFVQGPRILKLVGDENAPDAETWMASDLTSDDVIISKEDALNQSTGERKQLVRELLQYKLFDKDVDPRVRRHILQVMELGDWENIDQTEKANARKQVRENKMIKAGVLPQAKIYDMHSIHMEEIDSMRLDSVWEEMIEQNPQLEVVAQAHWQMHKDLETQIAMEQAQRQMGLQMASMGGPDNGQV